MKVLDSVGNDVTDQFHVETESGNLVINPKALTLKSADLTKEYDGTALTNADAASLNVYVNENGLAVEDGWVGNEGATYDFKGSQTLVGKAEQGNMFTYRAKPGTKLTNYQISATMGNLEVTSRTIPYEVTVKANSLSATYDGKPKTANGFGGETAQGIPVTANGQSYYVTGLTSSATGTNVLDSGEVPVTGTAAVKDAEGNDVTEQFSVKVARGSLTISRRNVTLASADLEKEYDGTPLRNSDATALGVPVNENGLKTETGWAEGEGATYTFSGSQTVVGHDVNAFSVKLNGNTDEKNYNISKHEGKLEVTRRGTAYEVTVKANSLTATYDGNPKTASGFEGETAQGIPVTANGQSYYVTGLTSSATGTNVLDSGEVPVTGTAAVKDAEGNDVTEQFSVKVARGSLTISRRTVTLTSATDSKQYDGTPLTSKVVTPGGEGWANGEGATYNVTGSRTLVGSSANTFKYTLNANTDENNYTITKSEGTLTILNREAKYQITVEANSATDTYDGIEKSASGFKTLTFTENGQTYTVSGLTAEAAATDAGNYPVNVLGIPMVKDADGNDVTPQFSVDTRNGTLTIEKRKVTLLSASFTKPYDGKALTNNNAPLVTEEGWADGEGATYTFTGTQTLAGDSANAFTYKLNSNTKDSNYNIDKQEGRLIVRDRDQKYAIVVEANSDTVTYNGKEQAVSGLAATTFVTEDGNTYTVEGLKAEAKATDAGTYTAAITGETIVRDSAGNDVTRQFAVVKENGTLTIRKAPLTLTAASASKPYDGTELTAHNTASITGAVEGEQVDTAELRYEGSQTEIGSSLNRIMQDSVRVVNPGFLGIRALGGKDTTANYEIRLVDGTLTVNQRNDLEYTINRIFLDRSGNEADRDVTRSQQAYYGEKILKTAPEIETTWKDSHYMLLPAWGDYQETKDKTVTLKAEDNIVNIYYALDDAATGSPEENKGDRIPDMYQIVFTYTAKENGTVSGVTTEAVTVQELVKDQNGLVIETGGRKPASPTQPSTVKANDGYYFHHWNNGSVELKDDAAVKAGSYETDTTFTAFFKENPDNAWTAEKRVTNIPS